MWAGLLRRARSGLAQLHKKSRVQLSPRNPADAFTVYEAGLSPSRRTSVMAQLFRPIHELTGALTQGTVTTWRKEMD